MDEKETAEVQELLKSLALIMGEALLTANAVRRAIEEHDPALEPLIAKHYADLQATAGATLRNLFPVSENKKLEELLRSFSSKTIH